VRREIYQTKSISGCHWSFAFFSLKMEKSSRQLDLEMAYQMSRYLNVTLDELMGEPKQNRASLNMDQMTLFDVDSYQ